MITSIGPADTVCLKYILLSCTLNTFDITFAQFEFQKKIRNFKSKFNRFIWCILLLCTHLSNILKNIFIDKYQRIKNNLWLNTSQRFSISSHFSTVERWRKWIFQFAFHFFYWLCMNICANLFLPLNSGLLSLYQLDVPNVIFSQWLIRNTLRWK